MASMAGDYEKELASSWHRPRYHAVFWSWHFRTVRHFLVPLLALALFTACSRNEPTTDGSAKTLSDPDQVRSADYSILFVGNSHTSSHDLPKLVGEMIRFRHPEKTVYSRVVSVAFLEDVARDPRCREELEAQSWKFVVLQAQKESRSGQFEYSRTEGIDIAKRGKTSGATVLFFAEWGLKDEPGHGVRIEKMYQEMAADAGAQVAPVGRAWDLALSARPDLPLHAPDGNHQTALGAFLTACVLCGQLTGESPADLAAFPFRDASEADRQFLADFAAKSLIPVPPGNAKQ